MENRVVCDCFSVTVEDIKNAILNGATSVEDVENETGAGSACGMCIEEIESIVNELLEENN